jgi:hypothetical protein
MHFERVVMGNLVLYCVGGTWVASDLQAVSGAVATARGVMGAWGLRYVPNTRNLAYCSPGRRTFRRGD